ncbi:MAG: SDR family NAD(P)-dependent oxidoreductase [Hyphomonadaceae bacterium]|nr:SDR family NAD(P)-dependent oxidoreductase [Hyphomonadaceae bacterium]
MSQAVAHRVIILGAQSAIAEAAARLFAAEGAQLVLAGRDLGRLNEIGDDLRVRGAAAVNAMELDLVAERSPIARLAEADEALGGASVILIAFGVLGDEERAETDAGEARRIIDGNFTSAAVWALAAANLLERRRAGVLMAIGSVAGDRGRASNAVYGAAKAGLAALMQGIAHRLAGTGARALVIKPGTVDTPMTAAFDKGPLWSKPEAIARVIWRAADRGGPVLYAPRWWRYLMWIVRAMPAPIMHRTRL